MDSEKVSEASVSPCTQSFGNIHQHLDLIAGLPCEDYEELPAVPLNRFTA